MDTFVMNKAIVIFTGINFSHYMAGYAVDWAARNHVPLVALFLIANREKEEGYGFPSDLDAAEKLKDWKDAEKDDAALLQDYQKVFTDLGREKQLTVSTKVLTDPSNEEVIRSTKDAAIVFLDATYDPTDLLSPKKFSVEELKKSSYAPVEVVREPETRP